MKRFGKVVLLCFSLSMVVGSLFYILGDPAEFSQPFKDKYTRHLFLVRSHGIFAALALVGGSLNLMLSKASHRWIGRIYMLGIIGGGLTGIPMSLMAEGGYSARTAFTLVSTLWLVTGVMAWKKAVDRQFKEHKIWIVRNFALTFGAVVFRFTLTGFQQSGFDFSNVYANSVWISWALAILAGEWCLGNIGRPYQGSVSPR